MFKVQRLLRKGWLLGGLVWLLAGCGVNSLVTPMNSPDSPLETVKTLEQNLNEGKIGLALNLFSEGAVVLEVHRGENAFDPTSDYYTSGGYYIPRVYSANDREIFYKGSEEISLYLSNLVEHKFQSSSSTYLEDTGGVTWWCQADSQMEFKVGFQEGKIITLTAISA